ncbi:uncharacterized mitochondrial protein-like protein [Tanacetum coccineum]|uniref:Uncharacterized mitochondrial protein-like protein n=1 Tax=Tanacetum coccineum TaxID=301880 RepID=A0ABQ5G038_9ASTR
MNYEPIVTGTQSNGFAGTKASDNACQARKKTEPIKDYILLPLWIADPPFSQDPKISHDDGSKPSSDYGKKVDKDLRKDSESNDQEKEDNVNNTNNVNASNTNKVNVVGGKISIELPDDPNMSALEDYSIFDFIRHGEDDGIKVNMNNLNTTIQVSPNPTTRIHKDHPLAQVIGDLRTQNIIHALTDPSWIEAIQEELLLKLHEVLDFRDSSMGELTFFLGLQVQQKKDGIFISQDKYVVEILKKFGFTEVKTASTPIETQKPLLKDENGEEVDVHMYMLMIGSLMYSTSQDLTSCLQCGACARYQSQSKVSHLHDVKKIFRQAEYLLLPVAVDKCL